MEKCILSIIRQSYQNWECILVDDGSTDGSGSLCDELALRDTRIQVIHKKNGGVSDARNRGLVSCSGDYICFVDSDDWVGVHYLKHLISGMTCDSIDMVVTGEIHEYANKQKQLIPKERIVIQTDAKHTQPFIDNVGFFYGPCGILFKHSIIEQRNLSFPKDLSFGEDTTFVFDYLRFSDRIALLPFADYHYRKTDVQTLSHRFCQEKTFYRYELWIMRQHFFVDYNMWNDISKNNMYRELWSIIYDGIYSTYNPKITYLKQLLSFQEISQLKEWESVFNVPRYIKKGIEMRAFWLFWLIRKCR